MHYTLKCLIIGSGVMGVCGFWWKIFETSIKTNLAVNISHPITAFSTVSCGRVCEDIFRLHFILLIRLRMLYLEDITFHFVFVKKFGHAWCALIWTRLGCLNTLYEDITLNIFLSHLSSYRQHTVPYLYIQSSWSFQ